VRTGESRDRAVKTAAVADNNDLLSADEIEALIQAARTDAPPADPAAPAGSPLAAAEIEALLPGRPEPPRAASATEAVLQQAESHLAAAMAKQSPRGIPPELGTPAAFQYQDLGSIPRKAAEAFPLSALQDVELDLRIELGRTELLIDEVLKLREGSVVPLDKLAGDPVDILVNGRLVARGEVLVLNDNFCVRVAEILTPEG
jgi:flagellar motor switch protein FliN/FliY